MLNYDLDFSELIEVARELKASQPQFKASLSRACNRTAATLRKMSSKGLKDELQLRTISLLRKRLKSIKLRASQGQGVQLWYGLNDMPVSSFRGTPKNDRQGQGAWFKDYFFAEGFVAKSNVKGRRTIFKRKTKARLPIEEQLLLIKDKADVFIEDEIFNKVEDIFWHHFRQDITRRVKYSIQTSERWG